MPIHRANKPYDPNDNAPGTTFSRPVDPTYLDPMRAPPKPGVSGGLLAWTLTCAAITIITGIVLFLLYK